MIKAFSLCAMTYEGFILSNIGIYATLDECKEAVKKERQVCLRYYKASLFHGGQFISSVNIHTGKDWEKKIHSKKDFTNEENVWVDYNSEE
jgi:hypothetical protein